MLIVKLECLSFSGQVSVQRCVLMVRQYRSRYKESVEAFIEESVVRRELADNFCYYNKHYDRIEGMSHHKKARLFPYAKTKAADQRCSI